MEFEWLGVDRSGQIAVFSSFSTGFIPPCVTGSMELFNELVNLVESIPYTSAPLKVTRRSGRDDDWENYAWKGMFGYDNANAHSSNKPDGYELIYKPSLPIIANVNIDLKKLESIIPVFNLVFSDFIKFDVLKQALI